MKAAAALLLALAGPAAAPAAAAPALSHAWARPTMGAMGMSAVYLDIRGGAAPDRLLGASTPAAASLELHRTEVRGAVTSMRPAGPLDIPAGGEVRLAPGGLHLMLMGARRPLTAGARIPVTLRFAHAGPVTVQAQVLSSPPRE